MGSADEVDVVFLEELFDDGLSEGVGDAAIVLAPAGLAFLGVGPEQVAEEAVLRDLGGASDLLELGDGDELGGEAAMHAEDLVVDEGGDGHAVEHILELFPDADRVAALALVVEAVDAVDLAALVIAAQQEEVLLELYFVGQQQDDGLQGVLSAIDIVAQEEIVGLGRESAVFEQPEQIRKLTVGVTANFDGSFELEEHWLLHEDFARNFAQERNILLADLDVASS
mmetsp:Transcript_2704/g.3708  ORF Transcript_2704/g.3708 Transcript_2704/m.3708 type:complete len:226 (+) Transcript_2704:410-1087(+)